MNYRQIRKLIGYVLMFEAGFLLIPCLVAAVYREQEGWWYLFTAALCLVLGRLLSLKKNENQVFYAKDGFVTVALSWIVISVFGALPFTLCGDIPDYLDALFETVSGFTTTGSSILTNVEALSRTSLMWRSFTHWVGGMGVLVFLLAIVPLAGGHNMHLMRAESPGPSVGKLVPRLKDTATILYIIYFAMTMLELVLLLFAGMPLFDSFATAFGTAGTGGFGIKNDSFASYTSLQQMITAVFMVLFGVNFNAYFFLLGKNKKEAFRIEEVRWYFGIVAAATVLIAFMVGSFRDAFFQVASIITTTGFATADFNQWPQTCRILLVGIMFIGACAGSTGGGIKVSRILLALKDVRRETRHFIHPRIVQAVTLDGKAVDKDTLHGVGRYILTYILIFVISVFIVSFNNLDFETTVTSVVATLNNIGPGLSLVGPAGNFSMLSPLSKVVLMFDMLAGRLELFPMLLVILPSVWRRK